MTGFFKQQNILYNLRALTDFATGQIDTVNNDLKALRYLGPNIWDIIPPDIRHSGNIKEFTTRIKCYIPKNCPSKLCRNYIQHVGYVN